MAKNIKQKSGGEMETTLLAMTHEALRAALQTQIDKGF